MGKRANPNTCVVILVFGVLLTLPRERVWARPTTAQQAQIAVTSWLRADPQPLGAALGQQVSKVETFTNHDGEPVYYIVYVEPSGFVIVPADDLVEPIIGFAHDGTYDPSLENPLGALVTNDLRGRVEAVQDTQRLRTTGAMKNALKSQAKWEQLESVAQGPVIMGLMSVSDVRVAPLVQSKWDQSTVNGLACYNYYTPPYAPDTPSNYPCGCVATALAQLMRFHEYPSVGVGAHSFVIEVDGAPETAWTRGGDGAGGPYNWTQMVFEPNSNSTPAQRQAIGTLCYDAGISVNMSYTSSNSGSDTLEAKDALTTTFGYSNAVKGYNEDDDIGPALNEMVNPNLDYHYPVILGINGPSGGHAVIADGYGYDLSTLYHHLNLGWSGTDDAWYNLPNIDSAPSFTSVHKCIYNIFVSGSGEIISGRVVDVNQDPISGATVTVQGPGDPNSAITNTEGIYALGKLSSASTYTIAVSKDGYTFGPPRPVATGVSGGSTSGNRWAVDFEGTAGYYPVIQTIPDQVEFSVKASAPDPEPQILSVRNSGFGTLNWVIDYDCNWLEVDPCEGISTGDINEVTLTVATTGMALGSYNCQLTLSDPCAFNNPKTVQVNLSIWDVLLVPTPEYPTIQAAIDAAADGCIIIIAPGTYTGPGNRDIDFLGKAIAVRSEDPNDPDIVATTIIDCSGTPAERHRGFYLHTEEGQSSILNGLTITNGYAPDGDGGGIFCVGASPTIKNCTISSCQAGNIGSGLYNYGGGISNKDGSFPTLINCTFRGNSAQYGGGMHNRFSNVTLINCAFNYNSARYGGAMYNYESNPIVTNSVFNENSAFYAGGIYIRGGSEATLTNCTFTGNFGDSVGGGIYNRGVATLTYCTFTANTGEYRGGGMNNEGTTTLTNCTFNGNAASTSNGNGGGMSALGGSSTLENCIFIGNSASFYGGGVYCSSANQTVINCTFAENSVGRHGRALATRSASQVQLTNCILWDGGDEIFELGGFEPSTITVQYSDVQGGWGGTGNINSNPRFVTELESDYYLSQVAAGQAVDSPCLDAGGDLAANLGMDVFTTRTDGVGDMGVVDMGFHYPPWRGPDINRDLHVDSFDYCILAAYWLQCNEPHAVDYLPGDIIRNRCVDGNDLKALFDSWLDCYVGTGGTPTPHDAATGADPNLTLAWLPGYRALSHDVYFGTDADAVADADHLSPEFMGTVLEASFDPCTLEPVTEYHWRVDAVGPRCTQAGDVWSFTTGNLYPVGWWKFDEGQGDIAYDSAGTNHGSLRGDPNWVSGYIGGYALDFDGNGDHVEVADHDSLTPTDNMTIMFWIYNRGGQNAGIYKYAACPERPSSPGNSRSYYVQIKDSTDTAVFGVFSAVTISDKIETVGTVSKNEWHHITATFSEGHAALYIDGQLDNFATLSVSSIMNDAQPLIIGGNWSYCDPVTFRTWLNGVADDIRVYNRALSTQEIQQLYQP
jgi:hypothetical protein